MDLKRKLITSLPQSAKRVLAVPYDYYQTSKADRQFSNRDFPSKQRSESAPDHIICVVVDALRADHVNSDLTPYLSGLTGTTAVSPGTWTFPTVSSLLSGLYPHEHGAMRQTDDLDDTEGITLPPRMDEDQLTITDALAGAGYDSYGGFGHDTPFVALSGRFQTHELYHTITAGADELLDDYLDWVEGRDQTFAFLHLADPHAPVDPPSKYKRKHNVDDSIPELENWRYQTDVDCESDCQRYREHRRRLYRSSVDYVDDALERFDTRLNEIIDEPLLVVTSDHGEAHWEHLEFDIEHFGGSGCVDHGGAPYEEIARVPLLTNADWAMDGLTSLIDLPATFTDVTGIEFTNTSGRSLCESHGSDRFALIEGSLSGHEKKAVYHRNFKLLASKGHGVEVGYSLPEETITDLPDDIHESLRDQLPAWPAENDSETEVSSVVENRLEKLGYK
ncbi:sulfatase-like hydrolase/transferase [Halorubrum distributum]|nr:sulfatase-like hydrolase/transferase [Halorubrum litoreum]